MTAGAIELPQGQLGPLEPEHFVQLRQAQRRGRKIRGAVRFAAFSGWTTFLFGLAALPFGIGDGPTLAVALALIAIGYHELALRRSLRQLQRSAPGSLAINQVLLALVLVAYAGWHLLAAIAGAPGPAGARAATVTGHPQVDELLASASLESLGPVITMVNIGVYAGLIAGTLLFQGLAVRYYLSRRRHLSAFLAETPGWVITLHRAGVMG